MVKSTVIESKYGDISASDDGKSFSDNPNEFIRSNPAQYTVMAAQALKEGGLAHIKDPTIQKHIDGFLKSYDEIIANPDIYNLSLIHI